MKYYIYVNSKKDFKGYLRFMASDFGFLFSPDFKPIPVL